MSQIFLTSYFTEKPHPQAMDLNTIGLGGGGRVINNSFKYIQPWYESICDLDLAGIVFHDRLRNSFVKKYRNKNVQFIKCKNDTRFSNNDYRYLVYYDFTTWLEQVPDFELNKPSIHMTDCCDVTINSDPLEFITGKKLYLCQDTMKLKDYSFAGIKIEKLIPGLYEEIGQLGESPLLNMGVMSGRFNQIKDFLTYFNSYRNSIESDANLNMPLGNYIIRRHMNNVYLGFPYCTPYKQNVESKLYHFRHK